MTKWRCTDVRYLVTGGTGFIGSALVGRLLDDGHEVRVLDDMSRGVATRLTGLGCEIVRGDVRHPDDVAEALHGCDGVAHLAYLQGTQTFYAEPRQVLDVAVRGITNVLAACESQHVGNLLLVSSSEAYQVPTVVPTPETVPLSVPDPLNPRYSYGGGKIISELMAIAWAQTGVLDRLIIARPHNVYGPDMGCGHVIPEFAIRMNRLAIEHADGVIPFPIQGTGQETRSFCFVDDCTEQLALLLAKAGPLGIYHVGTMDERTIADVAYGVAACYGREIKVTPGTLPEGSPPRRLPDTAKVEALGYRPRVGFAEGLARTVKWYQAYG
jgi:nucleoside-diphosphate-sugar epimerase